jgi:protein involved in polysaccharide export with SLBB domain
VAVRGASGPPRRPLRIQQLLDGAGEHIERGAQLERRHEEFCDMSTARAGKMPRGPALQPGDVVFVPMSESFAVGGVFDTYAKKTSVTIVRKDKAGTKTVVDVKSIIEEGKLEKDMPLNPGDIVFVGESSL